MSTAITTNPVTPSRPLAAKKKGLIPPKFKPYLAPILVSVILLVGEVFYGILQSYWHTGLAIVVSIAFEMLLGRWVTGRWPHLASAYITGISIGMILRSEYLLPYVLCSLLSISSKYALRVGGRHLFNPSNLGLSVMLFLLPAVVAPLSQQWGNEQYVPLIIMAFGALILYSLGRLHISATYVAAFCVLAVLRSYQMGYPWLSEIAPVTSPAYLLFIFFMITDPKTTTRTWQRQCAVVVLVALVEHGLRMYGGINQNQFDIHAPYYALFVVAPVTNLIEIAWDKLFGKKPLRTAVAPAPAAIPSPGALTTGIVPASEVNGVTVRTATPSR